MNFLIIRGELPFDDVIDMLEADDAATALQQACAKYKRSPDVFVRHPVVEPLDGGSSLFYS